MRKLILIIALLFTASPAYAHHHGRHHHHKHQHAVVAHSFQEGLGYGLLHQLDSIGPRPSRWCGWEMRRELGVRDPAYNLARNWVHYGAPTYPHVGVIVVWPHHVGRIVGGEPGAWVVHSGNDGHAVRDRVRSVGGAIAFRI
jgi:hypothetical protein